MKMEQFFLKCLSVLHPTLPFGSQDVTGFLSAHLPPLCCLAADHTGDNLCLGVRVQHKNLYLPQAIPWLVLYCSWKPQADEAELSGSWLRASLLSWPTLACSVG